MKRPPPRTSRYNQLVTTQVEGAGALCTTNINGRMDHSVRIRFEQPQGNEGGLTGWLRDGVRWGDLRDPKRRGGCAERRDAPIRHDGNTCPGTRRQAALNDLEFYSPTGFLSVSERTGQLGSTLRIHL